MLPKWLNFAKSGHSGRKQLFLSLRFEPRIANMLTVVEVATLTNKNDVS